MYGNAPMRPVGHHGQPVGRNTLTHPLNVGVTTSAPTVPPASLYGIGLYITQTNGSILYLQETVSYVSTPAGTTFYFGTNPAATRTPPSTNTFGIAPPPLPVVGSQALVGSTLPAGTYTVAFTYLTSNGSNAQESLVGPAQTISVTSGQELVITMPALPATTGPVQVEIDVPHLEDWHVTRYAVLVSTSTSTPGCNVYVDTVSLTSLLDTTALGAQNSGNSDLYLRPGQRLVCVWTSVDLGASCTFSVFGEKTSIPR